MMRSAFACSMALFLMVCFAAPAMAAPRAVVFDFELIDTSLGGEMKGTQPEERARLAKMGPELRDKLAASGRYEIVPLGTEEAEAKSVNLQSCGGCDVTIAKKLGADLSITGTVQKVSDILLTVNIYIRDIKTGQMTDGMSADVRNNTDESWRRGLSYLIRNRLLVSPDKDAEKSVLEKSLLEKNAQ